MLMIGNINLEVPFFQSPLSGYSDYAMRRLALDFGAPLTFAGVMLAKSAAHPKVISKPAFQPHDDEHPIGAQILGEEPKIMVKAAKDLIAAGYDLIDLNFACPAPKVLRRGRGGALLNSPKLAVDIFKCVRESISSPLTVKLRAGYDSKPASLDNFREIASGLIKNGADALVVHSRTVTKRYRGEADWSIIAELKSEFPKAIIIASGDVMDPQRTVELMRNTGVDGFAVARGAIGNPWIYRDLRAIFEGKPLPDPPTIEQQKQTILKHLEIVNQLYVKAKTVRYFRKFLAQYCRLHPQRRKAQRALMESLTKDQLLATIEQWYDGSYVSA
jgi:nifR3 family TIM-barrel protein